MKETVEGGDLVKNMNKAGVEGDSYIRRMESWVFEQNNL
jgi:hypothetical protein